jgi:acyl carrier protein
MQIDASDTRIDMQTTIEERVKREIAFYAQSPWDEIPNDAQFEADLGFDSLDSVETVMAIEDEFGIEISDKDAEKLQTIQQAIDFVTAKVS